MHLKNEGEKSRIEIYTFFHPIISIKDRTIIAMEALSRYSLDDKKTLTSISHLFDSISSEEQLMELDLFLISRAVSSFKESLHEDDNTLLFLNISSSVIKQGESGVYMICNILEKASISPRRIVLEILEDDLDDSENCRNFFRYCRKKEFLLALDDVGIGFSNLHRIALVKPDVIKLDITLVTNHHKDFYKKKVFESLVNLAHDIGALVVAEGVEDLEETLSCLLLGAGLVQGFFFCTPQPQISQIIEVSKEKIRICREELKLRKKIRQEEISLLMQDYQKTVNTIIDELSAVPSVFFEKILESHLDKNRNIDCLFILDNEGIQFSESVYTYDTHNKHFLFQPAIKGTDHSLKPYFLEPEGLHSTHVTSPYISQASGKSCITYSRRFSNGEGLFILCVDYCDFSENPPRDNLVSTMGNERVEVY